jgi:hypothetical protein
MNSLRVRRYQGGWYWFCYVGVSLVRARPHMLSTVGFSEPAEAADRARMHFAREHHCMMPTIPPQSTYVPWLGSDVDAWIKRTRDKYVGSGSSAEWIALDNLLGDYRAHARTNTPLDRILR